ncbi:uncharacterized protein LOC126679371 [Mercurialis annua]|uniref:uncharacterized protein LOC126679371 n=1 Tax=Mercurialis annua TaxID=3986 RepID=UPI00215F3E1D|nr:uncharacterized protein LOC126679371 [Mercurialis annua]
MEKPASLSPPSSPPTLRRRNSIATSLLIPTKLTVPNSQPYHTTSLPPLHINGSTTTTTTATNSSDVVSFELSSFNSSSLSYTSLKDILPSVAVNSPTGGAATPTCGSAYEISIRNRLVKQAAWAYLQPMSSSPDSTSQHFLRRLWLRFSTENPINACIEFITRHIIPSITQFINRMFRLIGVPMNR